jgi:hypothetical protein
MEEEDKEGVVLKSPPQINVMASEAESAAAPRRN